MPKRAEPKSEVVFLVAKPPERPYLLSDGNRLALRIRPDGSKTWLLRYRHPSTGKVNFLSLGPYPEVALVDASKSAAITRSLVRNGTDPVLIRSSTAEPKPLHADAPLKGRSISSRRIGSRSSARSGPTRPTAKQSS